MDHLTELLDGSTPAVAHTPALDRVTNRITARKPRRGLVVAGIVALSLGGATAAAAGTGTLDDLINFQLNGQQNDHAWEMDITGTDGTLHCVGGIVVMPAEERTEFNRADYLAIKEFVQNHDWSHLEPDRSLLHDWQKGTAEQLAITADRSMIEIAIAEGYAVTSISTMGTAQCFPK